LPAKSVEIEQLKKEYKNNNLRFYDLKRFKVRVRREILNSLRIANEWQEF
jgi:hypothetical protein